MAGLSSELLAGKLAKTSSSRIVRTEGLVVRVLRIRGNLLRHLPHLVRERLVMRRVLEQRLDPALAISGFSSTICWTIEPIGSSTSGIQSSSFSVIAGIMAAFSGPATQSAPP
jgi:hypothetical protein